MKVPIIIQARINSARLYGKVFKKVKNKTLIEYLLDRLLLTKLPLVLAVPEKEKEAFSFLEKKYSLLIVGGSEEDLLLRYEKACEAVPSNTFVRVTADNPLTSVKCLLGIVRLHDKVRHDVSYFEGLPYGAGVEVVKTASLKKAASLAVDSFEREHPTQFLYRNQHLFCINIKKAPKEYHYSKMRISIDTKEDLKIFSKRIFSFEKNKIPSLLKIIQREAAFFKNKLEK